MSSGKIPGPYQNSVKLDRGLMETVPFETMGIGARKSGLPNNNMNGTKSLDHVGGSQGSSGKEGK